jgi:hypothetical protein
MNNLLKTLFQRSLNALFTHRNITDKKQSISQSPKSYQMLRNKCDHICNRHEPPVTDIGS